MPLADLLSEKNRRIGFAKINGLALPQKIVDPNESLKRVDEHLRDGNGLIVLEPHFSHGDFIRTMSAIASTSEVMPDVPFLIPIALHQKNRFGLPVFTRFCNVELMPIVTAETLNKENERKRKVFPWQRRIPWQAGQREGAGSIPYMKRGVEVLKEPGIVVYAPNALRMPKLEPFAKRSLEMFGRYIDHAGLTDRTSVLFTGLEIEGVEDYSRFRGLNIRRRYNVIMGDLVSLVTLRKMAEKRQTSIEQVAHELMLKSAPPAYRP